MPNGILRRQWVLQPRSIFFPGTDGAPVPHPAILLSEGNDALDRADCFEILLQVKAGQVILIEMQIDKARIPEAHSLTLPLHFWDTRVEWITKDTRQQLIANHHRVERIVEKAFGDFTVAEERIASGIPDRTVLREKLVPWILEHIHLPGSIAH